MARFKVNVTLLAATQGLYALSALAQATYLALAGATLAPSAALSTVPVSFIVIGTLIGAVPLSFFMKRHGRRAGFVLAASMGIASGLIGVYALYTRSFALLAVTGLLQGFYQAGAQYYRFAAMELVPEYYRSRAVAFVLGGGLAGALLGPALFGWANSVLDPVTFAGAFLALAVLAGLAICLQCTIPFPPSAEAAAAGDMPRPLSAIMRQPTFICAVINGAAAFALMILAMTAAPIYIVACGFSVGAAASVIQWHVVAMFLPSFFSGPLIARVGIVPILTGGAVLFAAGGAISLVGTEIASFKLGMALVGVAWNFLFTAATTLLAESYRPGEKAKVQASNEFIIFAVSAVASLATGTLLAWFGWATINGAVIVISFLVLAVTLWYAAISRRVYATAE